MLRFVSTLAFIFPLGTALGAPRTHFLLMPDTPPALARAISSQQLVAFHQGVSVVKVGADDIERFSHLVHERLKGCGGFIDVTEEVERGQTPEGLVATELWLKSRPLPVTRRVVRGTAEIADLVARADGDRLWAFLGELTAFPDRSATSANGENAAQFLKDKATAAAGHLNGFTTEFVKTGSMYRQPSVVATLPGSNPSLPAVVIGGHMDTFTNDKPGADDDGSGTSVVMETLRTIALPGSRFERTIHFIWYSAEERGLVGSKYVVDHFKSQGKSVEAAIQFDMAGYKSPSDADDIYLLTDYTNPALTQTLREVIQRYTSAKVGETKCGYACSDHANWHRAGIPAVFPFEASFDNMNQKLHTGSDKTSYLDKQHLLLFARVALAFLGEVAGLQ